MKNEDLLKLDRFKGIIIRQTAVNSFVVLEKKEVKNENSIFPFLFKPKKIVQKPFILHKTGEPYIFKSFKKALRVTMSAIENEVLRERK